MTRPAFPRVTRSKYIFSAHFATCVCDAPLSFADVGAWDGLDEPWAAFRPGALRVFGFEPDANDKPESYASADGRVYFPVALWKEQGKVTLHVATEGGSSSIHPPNTDLLQRFEEGRERPRRTQQTLDVPCDTLDSLALTAIPKLDFLKLDTQGSEYEILTGGERVLREQVLGVVAETWTAEVHRGQTLSGKILSLMDGLGFELFDVGVAASWKRRSAMRRGIFDKPQIIGLDLLFFKRYELLRGRPWSLDPLKLAALADLFGFTGYALDTLDALKDQTNSEQLKAAERYIARTARLPRLRQLRRIARRCLLELGITVAQEYPLLHY